ncbi:hypothetical protein HANVADRAFT_2985 [Hanseniaspora valbyensis NRRL Y-1626]|uniref:Uncharacterized protein n=1 Tax=Hanseniaspora valbyensis NRRL Y-1626 TaxID=766949 RepID=A0A1B7TBZ5_9ASCO|nr:hypothetical protein HANVADRAFT_2985 [Hanseniaspora valbyensis NRRL Y-1626]
MSDFAKTYGFKNQYIKTFKNPFGVYGATWPMFAGFAISAFLFTKAADAMQHTGEYAEDPKNSKVVQSKFFGGGH